MKTEKEIKKEFNRMWTSLESADLYLWGWIDALDWVMNYKLIKEAYKKVIK